MLRTLRLLFIGLLLTAVFSTCTKPGDGGRAQLNVHVFNGGSNVPFATVKIRYGANQFPGPAAPYDQISTCDYAGQLVIDNLKRGDYYLYAFKYDSTSTADPLPIFEGGVHFEITNRNGERSVVIDMANDPE